MKKIAMTVLILSLLLSVIGCKKTEELINDKIDEGTIKTEIKAEEPVKMDEVTFILDWLPNTNHTGIYTAIEKGYFEEEHIKVAVIQPSEGDATALVGAGKGEFGVSFQETLTMARTAENPIPVVAIAAIIQDNTSGFAGLEKNNIQSPKDFEGKVYGSWGTEIEKAFIKTMMEKEGADIEKLETIDIVSYDFLTSITNDVDFQWIYYGWDGIAAEIAGVPISFIRLQDIDQRLNFYTPIIITSENLIKEDPDLIKRFLRAVTKGYVYGIENPEEAVKDLLKHAPETDATIATASQIYLADKYQGDSLQWGAMKESIWTDFSDWMFENKVIQQKLDVKKAYTNDFLPKEK